MTSKHILATGGMGYIGSHTVVELIESGYKVTILDNLHNSSAEVLNRIEAITGVRPKFVEGDVRDGAFLDTLFTDNNFDAVIHYAGLKAVGESVEKPELYYDVNVCGSLRLLEAMKKHAVKQIVFSSTATVYGDPDELPLTENATLKPYNPYGKTKYAVEQLLGSACGADDNLAVAILRYFNPIGAHPSGTMGESPLDVPNNLMPYVTQVAVGKRPLLQVWGNDYDTPDGTGVRDYIHVVDLANAHIKALDYLDGHSGCHVWNIGVGEGYSVLDVVNAFVEVNNVKVPYEIKPRRPGDVAACYADPSKVKSELGWQATHDIKSMVRDSWHWQSNNPEGY